MSRCRTHGLLSALLISHFLFLIFSKYYNEHQLLRTGICSYGMSGKLFHAPLLTLIRVLNCLLLLKEIIMNQEKDIPNQNCIVQWKNCLQIKILQLIVVNTPTHLHFEHAKNGFAGRQAYGG